jgi:hypothetical protein
MAFSEQSLADARQQGYSDDEIFDHIAKSDERFSVAKQQGYSLDDIASHLKQKEGGVNYEDATSQSGQGPRDNRNEQAVSGEVQATNQVGVQADSMLPTEDQSQLRSDDQASVTTGVAQGGELIEGQTKDAQGGIQGEEDGQGLPSQVTTGNEAQVIAPQQAAMQAAPFGAEGVQSVPAKSFVEKITEDPKSAIISGVATAAEAGIPLLAGSVAARVLTPLATAAAIETGPAAPFIGAGAGLTAFAGVADITKRIVQKTEEALGISAPIREAQAKQPEVAKAAEIATITPFLVQSGAGLLKAAATGTVEAAIKGGSLAAGAAKEVGKRLAAGGAAGTIYEAGVRYPVEKGIQMIAGGEEPQKPTLESTAESALMMAALSGAGEEVIKNAGLPETARVASEIAPDDAIVKRFEEAPIPPETPPLAPEEAAPSLPKEEAQPPASVAGEALVVEPTAEAPAEAQPTKPSEAEIEETSGIPAIEGKPVEPETAVKIEEGVAPREGEGEAGQVAVEIKRPKTYQEAQDLIDSIENDLEGRGIDVFKLYNEGSESLEKIGYTKMPPELSEAYKIRDEIGKQELQTNVDDVKSILKNKTSDNEAKRVLKEYAIDETDAAGQYMASEYFASTVKSDPLKQAEKLSIILAAERGEFFDEVKDISEKTKQDAVDIVVGLGNYLGVDHAQSFKKQIAPQEVERLAIEKPAEALAAPQAEPTFIQKAESWADSVIKESAKRVSTGLDPEVLAAYAVKGSIVIGRGVRNFGVWSGEMVKQFGEEIRPHLKDIWSRAKSYAEDEAKIQMDTKDYIQRREEAVAGGGPTVMRGVSERLAEQAGEGTAEEYYIQADELVRRKSLSDAVVMEWVNSLTPEQAKIEYEKAIFAPASDEIAAIKGKLAARRAADLSAAGDKAGYARVVNEIGREATLGSYVLRDLQFLYKATPEGFTMLLEKVAEKKNIKINPEKIAEIEGQFKDFTEAGKLSEAKEREVINAQSEAEFNAALKDLEKLRKDGFKKQNALDKSVGGIWPKSLREEIIPTGLRGNFLTTMSIATNLAQNVLKGTFLDISQKLIRAKYSKAEALLTGKEPEYVFGLEQAVMYYATLAKESPELVRNLFRTALRQPLPTDKPVNIMEIRSTLNPMAAIKRLKGIYNKESLQYEGDYGFKEATKDLLEVTAGVPSNIMFDLLTVTDRPFRQAVMISEASGMARKLGLKGLEHEKFVQLPQRGIEKWARENIKDPAKRAEEIKNLKQELEDAVAEGLGESEVTIAGKNVTRGVSTFLRNIAKSNPISSLLVYANAPYVRFPLNFAVSAFKLANPEVAMVSFLNNAARGNSKKAATDFSIFASGVALAYAGAYLYDQGVIQTTDSPQTKAQKLSGELGRAGSINLSKLKRIVNGESSDTMVGDKIQRLDRLGLIGVGILAEADKQEALKKKKLLTGDVSFADAMVSRMSQLPVSLSYTLNQTFAKGVAGVVDALTQGEQKMEKLLKNTFSASLSLVAPNELSAISRYISDYTPNLNDPKFMKTLENSVRQRFGMTGDLPVKRGFWGEKVASTPEGANPIAYHFFDFTKQRKLPSVPATMEIIRLFEKTQDNRIIPAEVQDKITIKGTSYRLSAKDHERYQELVGGERLNRVNKLIDTPSYQSASVDRKADRYAKAIDRGARMGERKFLQELQKSGREAGEVLKIPRKELIRRISELENED